MARTQIEDELEFEPAKVLGKGTLERVVGAEVIKAFWVRACQRDHHTGALAIAEARVDGESSSVFSGPPANTWTLELPIRQGSFKNGDGAVSAVLVWEDSGDLFTLAWAECVHLKPAR
jgi:hypothetical protein